MLPQPSTPDMASQSRMMDWVNRLAVDIGPRPAGSEPESRARQSIQDELVSYGYKVKSQPFQFHFSSWNSIFFIYLIIPLFVASALNHLAPILGVLFMVWVYLLPDIHYGFLHKLPKNRVSTNLYAIHPDAQPADIRLLITAHLDTSRSFPLKGKFWALLHDQGYLLLQRVGLLVGFMAFVELLGRSIPSGLWAFILLGSSLFGLLLLVIDIAYLRKPVRWSSGANDNASGVAVLLECASQVMSNGSRSIAFLITSAEEAGLFGAKAFLSDHSFPDPYPAVLNLDMIGSGDGLNFISSAGILTRVQTDKGLNDMLKEINPSLESISYAQRKGDFFLFQQAGFSTASLENRGDRESWLVYHSDRDQAALIKPELLSEALELTLGFVRRLESE